VNVTKSAESQRTVFFKGEYSYRRASVALIAAAFLALGSWFLKLAIVPPQIVMAQISEEHFVRWMAAIFCAAFMSFGLYVLWWFVSTRRNVFCVDESGFLWYGREYRWKDIAHVGSVRYLTGVHVYFRKHGLLAYRRVLFTSPPLSESQFAALCERLEDFTRANFPHVTIGRVPEESEDG
jgi:hypothetical protein